MDYAQCLEYLDRLGNEVLTMKFGLESIRRLADSLGNPQNKFRSVLVAGTNGKGSVARILSNIMQAAGLRTGLYTSPHVISLEERFAVNGRPIDQAAFARHFTQVVSAVGWAGLPQHPTYFETITAVAFLYFAEAGVEIAILEIGMGGRLDSTNIVDPELSIIMPVGLDHQKQLGQTIAEIAGEKAGIIHPGRPVLVAPQGLEASRVIENRAVQQGSRLILFDPATLRVDGSDEGRYRFNLHGVHYQLGLFGRHQVSNAAIAVEAARSIEPVRVSEQACRRGVQETEMPGRIERIARDPDVFLDGGHNRDAAAALVDFLGEHTAPPRALVFGMMKDKDVDEVASILRPLFSAVYLTPIASPRSAPLEQLKQAFPEGIVVDSPVEGIDRARQGASTVVVAGSFYLVGEILRARKEAGDANASRKRR